MRAHFDDDLELQLAKIALVALVILWFVLPFLTAGAEARTLTPNGPAAGHIWQVNALSGPDTTPGS